jgi:hypothetical protein
VQSLRLEALEYFCVGRGCSSRELYSVGPNWLEYSCVDEEFVVCREKVSHFDERWVINNCRRISSGKMTSIERREGFRNPKKCLRPSLF